MRTTEEVVAERPKWLMDKLRDNMRQRRTRILIALCGAELPMNQAALLVALADEALSKAEAIS